MQRYLASVVVARQLSRHSEHILSFSLKVATLTSLACNTAKKCEKICNYFCFFLLNALCKSCFTYQWLRELRGTLIPWNLFYVLRGFRIFPGKRRHARCTTMLRSEVGFAAACLGPLGVQYHHQLQETKLLGHKKNVWLPRKKERWGRNYNHGQRGEILKWLAFVFIYSFISFFLVITISAT